MQERVYKSVILRVYFIEDIDTLVQIQNYCYRRVRPFSKLFNLLRYLPEKYVHTPICWHYVKNKLKGESLQTLHILSIAKDVHKNYC